MARARLPPSVGASETGQEDDHGGAGHIYEIRVGGELDPHWSCWFDGLRVRTDRPDETIIVGPLTDQAALYGLLAKVRDLGLPLLAVRVLDETTNDRARVTDPPGPAAGAVIVVAVVASAVLAGCAPGTAATPTDTAAARRPPWSW